MDVSVAHSFASFFSFTSLKELFRVEFCYLINNLNNNARYYLLLYIYYYLLLFLIAHNEKILKNEKERVFFRFNLSRHLYFITILLDWMHDNEKIINRYDLMSYSTWAVIGMNIFFIYYIFIFLQLQFLLSPNCQYNLKKRNRKLVKNQHKRLLWYYIILLSSNFV